MQNVCDQQQQNDMNECIEREKNASKPKLFSKKWINKQSVIIESSSTASETMADKKDSLCSGDNSNASHHCDNPISLDEIESGLWLGKFSSY